MQKTQDGDTYFSTKHNEADDYAQQVRDNLEAQTKVIEGNIQASSSSKPNTVHVLPNSSASSCPRCPTRTTMIRTPRTTEIRLCLTS